MIQTCLPLKEIKQRQLQHAFLSHNYNVIPTTLATEGCGLKIGGVHRARLPPSLEPHLKAKIIIGPIKIVGLLLHESHYSTSL